MRPAVLFIVTILTLAPILRGGDLATYQTPYYTLYTDVDLNGAKEAALRMTKMAEEYHNRTKDFSGAITQRMAFYLYKNPADYYAAGGAPNTGGYFNGKELVAIGGDLDRETWHTVQHEGFHQFAHFVIQGELPTWVNEGMAEYFGEGVFTGDGFVTGVIPQWRMQRIKQEISKNKFRSLEDMMMLSHEDWNADVNVTNYDQAWSMVQFLAHGENGKYQATFAAFMNELARGRQWRDAWHDTFNDTHGFETQWRQYWTNLPDNPTIELYVKANVLTFTSYLARAFFLKQNFTDFDSFLMAAKNQQLKSSPQNWLPPSLLKQAIEDHDALSKGGYLYGITISKTDHRPQIVCTMPDGRTVIGKFTLGYDKIGAVTAEINGVKK